MKHNVQHDQRSRFKFLRIMALTQQYRCLQVSLLRHLFREIEFRLISLSLAARRSVGLVHLFRYLGRYLYKHTLYQLHLDFPRLRWKGFSGLARIDFQIVRPPHQENEDLRLSLRLDRCNIADFHKSLNSENRNSFSFWLAINIHLLPNGSNKLTATLHDSKGKELSSRTEREYRSQAPEIPPDSLRKVYHEDVLVTEQIVTLFRK